MIITDILDQWRLLWENSSGDALENTDKIREAIGVPIRGWKLANSFLEYDQTLVVRGIFVKENITKNS